MARYREHLPQLDEEVFLTDSGLETTLIFDDGFDLPAFASFPLLDDRRGRERLTDYFRDHQDIARQSGAGFIFESVSWRANRDWGAQIGYSPEMLDRINRDAIQLLVDLRDQSGSDPESPPMVISGCVGPRDDAYRPGALMTEDEAEEYHAVQIAILAETEADLVSALTLTYVEEAIGIVRAARRLDMPVAISFTVETDGRLPSGQALGEAIIQVDAATDSGAAYFMVNCAHPTHLDAVLDSGAAWAPRLRGVRANSSRLSHAELDEATEIDAGDPDELARQYADLRAGWPQLTVLGGCCGTDRRHIERIAAACVSA
jgi:homocysteine S-methyltransferase